jgi:hypothetical protein
VIGNGENTLFWLDPWIDGKCVHSIAPELWDSVPGHLRRRRMVASGLTGNAWIRDIVGALTVPVIVQYLQLHNVVQALQLTPSVQDMLI